MEARPGWYPDVTQPDKKRWWDGARWTEHRRDADDPDDDPPPPPGRRQPRTDGTVAGWEPGQMPGAAPLPRVRTSGWAIASIVVGTLWIFGVGSVIGIVLALMAFREIRRSQGLVGGKVLATLGLLVSTFTLGLSLYLVLQFDEVVDTVKGEVVEAATREELREVGQAMERFRTAAGEYPTEVADLRTVDYRPEDDVSVAIARATTLTWCVEALHRDADTVWHLDRDGEPEPGRC